MTAYTAAEPPISTSGFSWGSFADTLIKGATTVAAAKYLSAAPSGTQVAAAATTPTGSLYTGTAQVSSPISTPVLIAGGAVVLGLVLVLALRK